MGRSGAAGFVRSWPPCPKKNSLKLYIGCLPIDRHDDPQATRYVVNFMHRTGLLQQFQYVTPEDDDDEPTGLAAMDLGVEDDGY